MPCLRPQSHIRCVVAGFRGTAVLLLRQYSSVADLVWKLYETDLQAQLLVG